MVNSDDEQSKGGDVGKELELEAKKKLSRARGVAGRVRRTCARHQETLKCAA